MHDYHGHLSGRVACGRQSLVVCPCARNLFSLADALVPLVISISARGLCVEQEDFRCLCISIVHTDLAEICHRIALIHVVQGEIT